MNNNFSLNNSCILITGGTGSFGHQFVETLLKNYNLNQIIVFSRDEKKQHDMRIKFNSTKLKFVIGDVRDKDSLTLAMQGVDFVFHAAALKQVPSCEFFPIEAVKTNIIGTQNVLDVAESFNIKKIVVLSTDKAVYPINAMGISKAMMEKLMLAKARTSHSKTIFCGVRYGNVMYSRGSVLPLFINQISQNKPFTVTNPLMTRFLLPLPIAIELVIFAFEQGENGDVLIRKSPASDINTLAIAMKNIFSYSKEIKIIGTREGEKLHETLVTQEELMKATEYNSYYRIRNLDSIEYDKFFSKGGNIKIPEAGYNSENTERLSIEETEDLLLSLREIQEFLKK